MQQARAQNGGAAQEPSSLKWWVLVTVIIGTFLGRLDQTIVNLALPKMIDDFQITVTSAAWIATAYILANAIFVPIWGKLGDTLGRKKIYILGFSIFMFGSLLAGFAWNLSSMIVFRVIQAVAASADYPTAMAILAITFPAGRPRAQALGIWSSSFAAASVFGPLIGGPLIDAMGWRWVFFINIPVGIVGLLMALTFVRESVDSSASHKFDWWGSITLGVSLSALVLVLDRGLDWGWFSWGSVACYLTAAAFLAVFIRLELRHAEPVVDLKFFKSSVFTNTLINNFLVFMGMMGSFFLIPIFAQTFLGYDATQTGYLFIPMAFMIVLAAPLGGMLTGKVQSRYVIAASTAVAAFGVFLLSFLDPRSTAWGIMIPLAVMAFGMGFGMSQRTNAIAAAVPDEEIGIASSVLALARNIAGAFGVAVFGTIQQNLTESNVMNLALQSAIRGASPLVRQIGIGLIILKAQVQAYDSVFWIAAIVLFVGALTSFWIKIPRELEKSGAVMVE
ncbi:MAG: multidrug efflux MFS transporter [Patescibacteria group bacterium]|nr:multidrug efflux MFS transporter [Patescibacteria group bacterium]